MEIASGTNQSAPRDTNTLTVEMSGNVHDTWTATRPVSYQKKIATEDWVDDKHYIPYTQDRDGYWSALTVGQRNPNYHVGALSLVVGNSNAAEGFNSFALGAMNTLSGNVQGAVAFGQQNVITKTYSTAFGMQNTITAANALTIGQSNTISAELGVAFGSRNLVGGKYGVAMGGKAQALDSGSFVWGGSDKVNVAVFPIYTSHGKGTFNINPQNGAAGFYIGEQSLSSMLSAFITSADVPVPSYIEDEIGNKIEADLDCTVKNTTLPWTLNNEYWSEPIQVDWDASLGYWIFQDSTDKHILKNLALTDEWRYERYVFDGSDWLQAGFEEIYGPPLETTLEFTALGITATRSILENDKLATEGYVSGIIGDINTILDNINGEVI